MWFPPCSAASFIFIFVSMCGPSWSALATGTYSASSTSRNILPRSGWRCCPPTGFAGDSRLPMSRPRRAPRSLRSLPLSFGGAFCAATSPTTSWVSAHDRFSAIPPLCFRVRHHVRGLLCGGTRQGFCSLHRFPVARHRARGHASLARCRRPRNGISGSCDVLVRLDRDRRTRRNDGRSGCCVVLRTVGALRLAGMGVGNSRPLDDCLCLSHPALVSSLAQLDAE